MQHTPITIKLKPIASPGVNNQGSYVSPQAHSNTELKYHHGVEDHPYTPVPLPRNIQSSKSSYKKPPLLRAQSDVRAHNQHVGNVLPKAHNVGASGAAGSSQPKASVLCEESEPVMGLLMHQLSENIVETVAEVNEDKCIEDIDSDLPQDPNLQCVVCGKIFKIGQIQIFKRHVAACAHND